MPPKSKKSIEKIQNIYDNKISVFFKKSILKSILSILTMKHPGFRTMKAVKNINRLFANLDLSKYQSSKELLSYVWCITHISKEWLDGIVDIDLIFEKLKRDKDFDNIKGEIISSSIDSEEVVTAPQVKMIFNLIGEALQFGYVASMREEYLSLLEDIDLNDPAAFKELVQRLFLISESLLDIKYNTNLVANKITFNTNDLDSVKESVNQTISSLSKSNNVLKVGIRRLNTLLSPGYMNGRLYVYLGLAGGGKAQPNNTLIPTPNGMMKLGDIKIGDYVLDLEGEPTKVTGVFPQGIQNTYEVTFTDGRKARCNKDHLWYTLAKNSSTGEFSPVIRKLGDMMDDYIKHYPSSPHKSHHKYIIPNNGPAQFKSKEVPLDPWVIGYLIGNGHCREAHLKVSALDDFAPIRVAKKLGFAIQKKHDTTHSYVFREKYGDKNKIQTKDVIGNIPEIYMKYSHEKRIPECYLINSVEVRMELLKGLMDSDGCISKEHSNEKLHYQLSYFTTSTGLVKDIDFLLNSLGFDHSVYTRNRKCYRSQYRININISNAIKYKLFSEPYKLKRAYECKNIPDVRNYNHIRICDIKQVEDTEQTCIMVDNPKHIYLTENFIPTHNSLLLLKSALDIRKYNPLYKAKTPGMKPCVLYITMENSFTETIERLWNLIFEDPITNFSPEEASEKLIKELGNDKDNTDEDSPSIEVVIKYFPYREISTDDLFVLIQDLRDENLEVSALILDYIMRIRPSVSMPDNALVELDRITNELKALAVMKDIPVITAHQMNRTAASIVDQAARNNKGDATKLVGREHVSSSFNVIMNADFAAVLNIEYKPGTDDRYMVINVVKRRRIDTEEADFAKYTYLAHPFAKKGLRLIDDMNLDKVLSVQSLVSDLDAVGNEKTNAAPRLKIMAVSDFVDSDDTDEI